MDENDLRKELKELKTGFLEPFDNNYCKNGLWLNKEYKELLERIKKQKTQLKKKD